MDYLYYAIYGLAVLLLVYAGWQVFKHLYLRLALFNNSGIGWFYFVLFTVLIAGTAGNLLGRKFGHDLIFAIGIGVFFSLIRVWLSFTSSGKRFRKEHPPNKTTILW